MELPLKYFTKIGPPGPYKLYDFILIYSIYCVLPAIPSLIRSVFHDRDRRSILRVKVIDIFLRLFYNDI